MRLNDSISTNIRILHQHARWPRILPQSIQHPHRPSEDASAHLSHRQPSPFRSTSIRVGHTAAVDVDPSSISVPAVRTQCTPVRDILVALALPAVVPDAPEILSCAVRRGSTAVHVCVVEVVTSECCRAFVHESSVAIDALAMLVRVVLGEHHGGNQLEAEHGRQKSREVHAFAKQRCVSFMNGVARWELPWLAYTLV